MNLLMNDSIKSVFKKKVYGIHLPTYFFLFVLVFYFGWANFRQTDWKDLTKLNEPEELGSVGKWIFFRGWPFSPFMFCVSHGGHWHLDEGFSELAFFYNLIIVILVVFIIGFVFEWFLRNQIHISTIICLVIFAGFLLWTNLVPSHNNQSLINKPNFKFDSITDWFYYRGWPFSPYKFNIFISHLAMPFDLLFLFLGILFVGFGCERGRKYLFIKSNVTEAQNIR